MQTQKNSFQSILLFYLVYIFSFQFAKDWYKQYQYKSLARKTTRIARRLELRRASLKRKINAYVKKTYNLEANSEFIPSKGVNKHKIHKDILHRYAEDMLEVSLYLTPKLYWK